MKKILIIRFSSIGDIIQCLGAVGAIKEQHPNCEIHWITRKDMAPILSLDERVDKIWPFDKKEGLKGLWKIVSVLKKEKFDVVYDAHSNIRSEIIKFSFNTSLRTFPKIITRSKERLKRILLFKFAINLFPKPFVGVDSFLKPLKKIGITAKSTKSASWDFEEVTKQKFANLLDSKTITLVPSANWEMKRWPVSHWKELIERLPNHNFIILAGKDDTFCAEIESVAPTRVKNLSGATSLIESCYITSISNFVVSGDTGFLHAADLFHIPTLALMGPTAFGFPCNKSSEIVELDMKCRPCTKDGRGGCKRAIYQECMVNITAEMVAKKIKL